MFDEYFFQRVWNHQLDQYFVECHKGFERWSRVSPWHEIFFSSFGANVALCHEKAQFFSWRFGTNCLHVESEDDYILSLHTWTGKLGKPSSARVQSKKSRICQSENLELDVVLRFSRLPDWLVARTCWDFCWQSRRCFFKSWKALNAEWICLPWN